MTPNPLLQLAAQGAVDLVMKEIKGVKACLVSTEDGFEVAARILNDADATRLAAMAGSMAALAAIAGEEGRIGQTHNVVIQAGDGHIVMVQARRPDTTLVLSIVTGGEALMGQLLYFSRQTARALERA
ncbi:roadblock/LC7 domain-containing protein [Variovorax sp. J22P168]|uniref:roadblock/LC7 domain-containing protein n=1 Tax=Variovorax jilinensis TaxID=3053513 RepID=UPI002579092A|nr:roadblock/LC7 domain-containing protein [Variovorax sp. J22P168]MDM0014626.1 roadblock/LC7 domain-containing protein [Variovorax sp. J22P168]